MKVCHNFITHLYVYAWIQTADFPMRNLHSTLFGQSLQFGSRKKLHDKELTCGKGIVPTQIRADIVDLKANSFSFLPQKEESDMVHSSYKGPAMTVGGLVNSSLDKNHSPWDLN